ncbi:hypothetical protein R6Q59_018190 [Mikania micrantha]
MVGIPHVDRKVACSNLGHGMAFKGHRTMTFQTPRQRTSVLLGANYGGANFPILSQCDFDNFVDVCDGANALCPKTPIGDVLRQFLRLRQ